MPDKNAPGSEQDRPVEESWHLDKRVPIAILATIFVQLAVGVWYASKADSRVSRVEEKVAALERSEEAGRVVARDVATTLATLREQQAGMVRSLNRIETLIDGGRMPPNNPTRGVQ